MKGIERCRSLRLLSFVLFLAAVGVCLVFSMLTFLHPRSRYLSDSFETVFSVSHEEKIDEEEIKMNDAPSKTFDRIVLLGERHSGTSYTTEMLKGCFPSLHVTDFLVRYKHWFQPTPDYVVNVTNDYLGDSPRFSYLEDSPIFLKDSSFVKIQQRWPLIAAQDNPKAAFESTLVIVMFRNAYDWLEAMRKGPHHWPNHYELYRYNNAPVQDEDGISQWYGINFLPWTEFVAANMTLADTSTDPSQLCQNAYQSGTVSPCIKSKDTYPPEVKKDYASDLSAAPDELPFNGNNPTYELDGNGKPFNNPLEFRTAKIKDFLDIPNKWDLGGFMILQHEEVNLKGYGLLLDAVAKIVGMEPSCVPGPPLHQASKKLDTNWTKWIDEHADWETEGRVGYEPRV